VAAAAALLLTACGGGGSDAKITSSSSTPSPTTPPSSTPATTPAAAGTPTFDFPSDVKITIDPDTTGDPTKDAILRDQAYGLDALYVAMTKHDKNLPLFTTYMTEDALETWSESIDELVKNHHSLSGTDHYYNRKVTVNGTSAGVSFCEDQTYIYDKDTRTGKVLKTAPNANDITLHVSHMQKNKDGIWQTTTYLTQAGGTQCRH
jgi:hypothetical protein